MSVISRTDFSACRYVVRVDGQTPGSWSDVLNHFADASIYQSMAYGAVRWGERNLSHLTICNHGQVLAAAQVRIIRMPLLPTGVAYVRWGPMCHLKNAPPDPEMAENMLECLRSEYCNRRGLVLQVMPNAYQGTERGTRYMTAFKASEFCRHVGLPSYRTFVVDLTPSAEVIRKSLDQKWRNQLNASERKGLELEVSCELTAYDEFQRLYQAMREAKHFPTNVDVGEFGRMQEQLPAHEKMTVFVARRDGEVLAALVCSLISDSAIYLLGATNGLARELKASYYLQWQAMMWLKERGARSYDLGGIDPEANPGGHHFKSGFGGREVTQIPAFSASGGMLGDVLNRGITWMRRRGA